MRVFGSTCDARANPSQRIGCSAEKHEPCCQRLPSAPSPAGIGISSGINNLRPLPHDAGRRHRRARTSWYPPGVGVTTHATSSILRTDSRRLSDRPASLRRQPWAGTPPSSGAGATGRAAHASSPSFIRERHGMRSAAIASSHESKLPSSEDPNSKGTPLTVASGESLRSVTESSCDASMETSQPNENLERLSGSAQRSERSHRPAA